MKRWQANGETMGGRYTAVYYAAAGIDTAALGTSWSAAVDKVDQLMSTWKPTSDLSRPNAAATDTSRSVAEDLLLALETDGEMRARGRKPDGAPWCVAIEKPVYGVRAVAGVMQLQDMAIATSGDYRRYIDIAGNRFAHTMHPALQQPVSNRLAAVTVLAPACMLADAWATALLVLGEHEGPALARQRRMDALFVLRDGPRFEEILVAGDELDEAS